MIYKILTNREWELAVSAGSFRGSEIDSRDGFIHFSSACQVRETVAKHFAGQTDLLLLAVDENSLSGELRWEISRGGDLFPHLYGELAVAEVRSATPLPFSGQTGAHVFPDSLP